MTRRAGLLFVAVLACEEETPGGDPKIHTPRWAFEPWISKDISNGADTYAFVEGFRSRDIPVGVVVLDSPWDTNYTMFEPNPARYPDFATMVSDLRRDGVRTVLWCTQMLNEESFDLEEGGDTYEHPATTFLTARRLGYLADGGRTHIWWKGKGAGLDFFNPEAVEWWHGLQDRLLDVGVSGWKLDFGESYLDADPIDTAAGLVPHQAYSEAYYRDFFVHGTERRGADEMVTMVRGYDASYHFEGRFFARPEHAPVVWAGDNRRDDVGLADALDHMFRSAAAGYVVVGSDIGGYLDRDDQNLSTMIPFDAGVLHRWIGIGALTPFMQLHGRANLEPWNVPGDAEETVRIYRYWAWLHRELVPFFYSLAEEAYAGGAGILRPVGGEADWPGDFRFFVGDAFLVAPILDGSGARDVLLPSGRWFDWWNPGAGPSSGLVEGYAADPSRVPLFVKEGAIVPANVERGYTGNGTAASAGALTVLLWPAAERTSFVLHDESGRIDLELEGTRFAMTSAPRPVILRMRVEIEPEAVESGGALPKHADRAAFDGADRGFWFDPAARALWVRAPATSAPMSIEVR
jgi:alpha-glucosidase (family GH31 glycosyl hydrolase)